MNELYEKFINDIADLVIKKITDSSSNMLNTVQYKVKAENIEGLIQTKQIEGLEDMISDEISDSVRQAATDAAEEAAYEALKNATFEVSVS